MKNTKLVVGILVAIAILAIGIGFAAIGNIQLTITGTAKATADDTNFTVQFLENPTISEADKDKVAATIEDDTTATISVEGLTTKGDFVTVIYEIKNTSDDLSANLTPTFNVDKKDYFSVTPTLAKTNISAGDTTTLTVKVELIQTPIEDVTSDVTVTVDAEPVQPAE